MFGASFIPTSVTAVFRYFRLGMERKIVCYIAPSKAMLDISTWLGTKDETWCYGCIISVPELDLPQVARFFFFGSIGLLE